MNRYSSANQTSPIPDDTLPDGMKKPSIGGRAYIPSNSAIDIHLNEHINRGSPLPNEDDVSLPMSDLPSGDNDDGQIPTYNRMWSGGSNHSGQGIGPIGQQYEHGRYLHARDASGRPQKSKPSKVRVIELTEMNKQTTNAAPEGAANVLEQFDQLSGFSGRGSGGLSNIDENEPEMKMSELRNGNGGKSDIQYDVNTIHINVKPGGNRSYAGPLGVAPSSIQSMASDTDVEDMYDENQTGLVDRVDVNVTKGAGNTPRGNRQPPMRQEFSGLSANSGYSSQSNKTGVTFSNSSVMNMVQQPSLAQQFSGRSMYSVNSNGTAVVNINMGSNRDVLAKLVMGKSATKSASIEDMYSSDVEKEMLTDDGNTTTGGSDDRGMAGSLKNNGLPPIQEHPHSHQQLPMEKERTGMSAMTDYDHGNVLEPTPHRQKSQFNHRHHKMVQFNDKSKQILPSQPHVVNRQSDPDQVQISIKSNHHNNNNGNINEPPPNIPYRFQLMNPKKHDNHQHGNNSIKHQNEPEMKEKEKEPEYLRDKTYYGANILNTKGGYVKPNLVKKKSKVIDDHPPQRGRNYTGGDI